MYAGGVQGMASRGPNFLLRLVAAALNVLYPQLPLVRGEPNRVFPLIQQVGVRVGLGRRVGAAAAEAGGSSQCRRAAESRRQGAAASEAGSCTCT